jgi:hypothetical protein
LNRRAFSHGEEELLFAEKPRLSARNDYCALSCDAMPASRVRATKCDLGHIRIRALALSKMRQGQSRHRGCENDDAADGILVVQIRHLRTVSGEIPEFATGEELMTTSMRAHAMAHAFCQRTAASDFSGRIS